MYSFIFLKNCHVSFVFFLTGNTCYFGKKDFNQNFTEPKPVAWIRASFSLGDRAAPKAHTRSPRPSSHCLAAHCPPTAGDVQQPHQRIWSHTAESCSTTYKQWVLKQSYWTPPSFSFLSSRTKKITVFHGAVRTKWVNTYKTARDRQ